MSKLADKIKKVTQLASQPLGFGSSKSATEATMVLAGVAKDSKDGAEMQKRGADVVILTGAKPESGKDVAGAIVGAVISGKADDEAKAYRESGFDFVVFDPNSASATALLEEDIGYVLTLPKDLEDNDVRTLESFQLDAIDIGAIDGALTVRRQIELRRVFGMTRKPLLARVKGDITSAELQALRDTNIVVVSADKADDIERLRTTIDALPPRARRKDRDDRPTPLVPRPTAGDGDDDDDDHDH